MLTDELINKLEEVTREYLKLCKYNKVALEFKMAAIEIGEVAPTTASIMNNLTRATELRTQMYFLQHEAFEGLRGRMIRIPNSAGRANMVVTSEDISFEDPMDTIKFLRLIKDQDS